MIFDKCYHNLIASGSGKTTTLVALAHYYKFIETDKFTPVLVNKSSVSEDLIKEYLTSDCDYNPSKSCIFVWITYIVIKLDRSLTANLMEIAAKSTVLTLIDIGQIEREDEVGRLFGIIKYSKNTVIAFSSGMYSCKSLSHSLSVIESESTIIQFTSVSKAEMDLYIKKVLPPGIDVEDIAVKTNCNPRLLEALCLRGGSSVINLALSRIETKITGSLSKASKPHFLVMSIHLLEKSYTNEKMTKESIRKMCCYYRKSCISL